MIWQKIIATLDKQPIYIGGLSGLTDVLEEAEPVQSFDTYLNGTILILKYKERIFVQEQTDRNEFSIRSFPDTSTADEFIKKRLAVYEKMWDGCGCKIDYYE